MPCSKLHGDPNRGNRGTRKFADPGPGFPKILLRCQKEVGPGIYAEARRLQWVRPLPLRSWPHTTHRCTRSRGKTVQLSGLPSSAIPHKYMIIRYVRIYIITMLK